MSLEHTPKRISVYEGPRGEVIYALTAELAPGLSVRDWVNIDKSQTLTPGGAAVIEALLQVQGINIWLSRYGVLLVKSEAFDWKDMEPDILRALRFAFPGDPAEIKLRGEFALDHHRVHEILREQPKTGAAPAEIPVTMVSDNRSADRPASRMNR